MECPWSSCVVHAHMEPHAFGCETRTGAKRTRYACARAVRQGFDEAGGAALRARVGRFCLARTSITDASRACRRRFALCVERRCSSLKRTSTRATLRQWPAGPSVRPRVTATSGRRTIAPPQRRSPPSANARDGARSARRACPARADARERRTSSSFGFAKPCWRCGALNGRAPTRSRSRMTRHAGRGVATWQRALCERIAPPSRAAARRCAEAPERAAQRATNRAQPRSDPLDSCKKAHTARNLAAFESHGTFVVACRSGWPARYTATSPQAAFACESPKQAWEHP